MKLFYAPQSPFARKVRAAAIELGLAERLELEYAEVVPGRPNIAFAQRRNPLRKVPALVTDIGETIYDSTVICEYLDALTGGGCSHPERCYAPVARADEPRSRTGHVRISRSHPVRNVASARIGSLVGLDR
jgi:glutathione S-transferase